MPTEVPEPDDPLDRVTEESEGFGDDSMSTVGSVVRLTDHLDHVTHKADELCLALEVDSETTSLIVRAARWHDLGKAHDVFQDTMMQGLTGDSASDEDFLAKTVKQNLRHGRAYFRHELASALAFLSQGSWSREADLVAYLIAAHHGKVRMNLRALPRESGPKDPERAGDRFARGIWEGDELPTVDLAGGERWEGGRLTLAIMEMGWDEVTKESWTERTRDLLALHGPFRLAWLETVLRIADWRASAKEREVAYDDA